MIFRPHVGGIDRGWVKTAPAPEFPFPDKDKWWQLKVEVEGDKIRVEVDNKPVLELTYPGIKSGRIGLTAWQEIQLLMTTWSSEGKGYQNPSLSILK